MIKGDPIADIVKTADAIRRFSPNLWDEFVKSVRRHADRAHSDLLAADEKLIMGAQGKAQALVQLAQKLEQCGSLNAQYRERV